MFHLRAFSRSSKKIPGNKTRLQCGVTMPYATLHVVADAGN